MQHSGEHTGAYERRNKSLVRPSHNLTGHEGTDATEELKQVERHILYNVHAYIYAVNDLTTLKKASRVRPRLSLL